MSMRSSTGDVEIVQRAAREARDELAEALSPLVAAMAEPDSPPEALDPLIRAVLEHGSHLVALFRLLA